MAVRTVTGRRISEPYQMIRVKNGQTCATVTSTSQHLLFREEYADSETRVILLSNTTGDHDNRGPTTTVRIPLVIKR